ncbi:uncharacterized protein LOC121739575 [Aricia agestis]|uniref:uncharacterized protein LOC121739575 n=1 Tax=Aricia agestis TaxID=91739 RepID=UPI001C208FA0|nr:uncharacterized protein LOC121739575 [Aricia agestis]
MQPPSNKLPAKKRPNVRAKKDLIPCKDNHFDNNVSHKNRKKTYLNLYILGKLWIDLLSKALVGEKFDITSAKATQTRESLLKNEMKSQPPKIQYQSSLVKYKDVPVYQDQNVQYKEKDMKNFFIDNVTRLKTFLVPRVGYYRTTLQKSFSDLKTYMLNEFERRKDDVLKTREKFRENMRDPGKLPYRYTAAATGGITGYLLAAGGGIPRRVLFTSLGMLGTGVVCFPNESDNIVKSVIYGAAKTCVYLYNTVTDDQLLLKKDVSVDKKEMPNVKAVKCSTSTIK